MRSRETAVDHRPRAPTAIRNPIRASRTSDQGPRDGTDGDDRRRDARPNGDLVRADAGGPPQDQRRGRAQRADGEQRVERRATLTRGVPALERPADGTPPTLRRNQLRQRSRRHAAGSAARTKCSASRPGEPPRGNEWRCREQPPAMLAADGQRQPPGQAADGRNPGPRRWPGTHGRQAEAQSARVVQAQTDRTNSRRLTARRRGSLLRHMRVESRRWRRSPLRSQPNEGPRAQGVRRQRRPHMFEAERRERSDRPHRCTVNHCCASSRRC